jgi:hypothetical protein
LRFKGKARSNIKLLKKERVPEERSLGEGPDQVAVQENVEGRRMEQMRRLRKITGGIGRSFQPLSDGYLDSLELFCMRSRHSLELRGLMFPGEMSMDTFISNWVLDRAHIFRSGHSFLGKFWGGSGSDNFWQPPARPRMRDGVISHQLHESQEFIRGADHAVLSITDCRR